MEYANFRPVSGLFGLARAGRLVLFWLALACGCASGGALVTPRGDTLPAPDRSKPAQWVDLHAEPTASYHVMHVSTRSKPERFLEQDAVWLIMRGRMKLHLSGQTLDLRVGDVVEVPRGTTYWAENPYAQPCSAYIVLSPAFTGEGRENVPEVGAKSVSSWHYTRWVGQ
jgi:mannose-6-phosphate isomerase-like protein (cupin superfamily)